MEYRIAIDVQAPPERVWEVMSDIERWHEWTPSVTRIKRIDDGPLGLGSRVRIRQPRFPPATWEVTAFYPGTSFTWVSRGPGARVTAHHFVERIPGGARATLSINFRGPVALLVGWITRGRTRRYLELEAAGLKRRSEEG